MPRARKSRKSATRRTRSRSPRRVRSATRRVRRVGSKKVNKWVSHTKTQAKKLGLTYKQALMDPRVKASYRKM